MSSQTVVDVVVSGTTATVVDARVDGVTTVAGAAPVTTVSGQVPDIGVITDFRTENITITSDGFNLLSGNLVSTGAFLTSEIAIVSGIAGGQDLTTLSGTVNTLSGNVIATGQYLTSEIAIVSGLAGGQDIDTLSGNLIATGQTLTSEIAIVSGLTTGSSSDPALSGKVDTLSGNLIATGVIVDDISGNLITTGQTLQTQITSNDSDITTLTTNVIATGQTLTSEINTVSGLTVTNSNNLISTGNFLNAEITIVSGLTTGSSSDPDLSGKVDTLSGNLITTGQTLTTDINTVSSNLVSTGSRVDDISGNLITTGQTLQTQITSNDSDITSLTSNLITTGQTLTTDVNTVSGLITDNDADITALKSATGVLKTSTDNNTANLITTGSVIDDVSGNLITTGQTLQTQITSNDNDISNITSNLVTTGQTLQTQITSNDSDISTLTSNLITTGQTLTDEIAIVSGIATGGSEQDFRELSGNLITTGQTLTSEIGIVSGLTVTNSNNLVSTGKVIDDVSGNLITTGQTLQTQITSNDGDISTLTSNLVTTGQTLTTNVNTVSSNLISTGAVVDDISGNLGTTGQTLQTQITANDTDITTLTSNLATTGNTLDTTTVKLTTNQSVAGNKIFTDTVTINNLTVTGTEVIVDVENLAVKDNIIEINSGEAGAGISRISGGITIDRGSAPNANILYNDANDRFELNFPLAVEGALVASAANLISTGAVVDDISGNLITTGQTLQTQITSNDSDISTLTSNLITTGQTLTSEIAIVSGMTTGGVSVDILSGHLITTGQTLQTQITTLQGQTGDYLTEESVSGTYSTQFNVSVANDGGGNKYYLSDVTGPSYTATTQVKQLEVYLNRGETYKFTTDSSTSNHPFFFATQGNGGSYTHEYTSGITNSRSQNGGILYFRVPQSAPDTLYYNCGFHAGMGAEAKIYDNTGILASSSNLISTGAALQTQITSNDADISTLTSNLVSTGSVVDDISGNLITTGQTLQTQITSNDTDITTLTSNLVTTGQTLTTNINTVSTNLISTGKVVDDISGNLITTGQTLQTQITSNDTDITNLSSNLVTTGQTLTTNINTVATNLVTTGQTLTSEIATVSGLIPATVIDGGGTANTVPLWSDANTLGDSVISQSSSKIGIGTASPSSLLHVYGADPVLTIQDSESTVANASAIFRIGESDGSANLNNNFNIKFVGTASGGDLDISRYNSTTLANQGIRIKHDGNVGIGTITPTSLLHVFSASSSQTYSTGADELVVEGSDHAGISILAPAAKRAQLYFNTDAFFRWVDNDGIFTIDTSSSSSKIAIAPGGAKVGIGTNAPASLLHIYSSAPELTIQDGGSWGVNATAYISLKDGSSFMSQIGVIGTDGHLDIKQLKAGSIRIFTNSSERMSIDSNGAVTFNGSLTVGADDTGHDVRLYGATSGRYWEWDESMDLVRMRDNVKTVFGNGDDLQIYHDGSNSYINDAGTGRLILKTSYFEVDNAAGNQAVIEGIESGAVNLFYSGSKKFETSNSGGVFTGASGRTTVTLIGAKTSDGNFADIYGSNNSDTGHAQISFRRDGANDAAAILFYTEATGSSMAEAVRINSAGCVGIGTAAPADTLHVYGAGTTAIFQSSSANGYISIKETSGGNHVYLGNQSGEFVIQTPGSSYSTKFQVTSVGLVGIGISPTTRLQVKDSVDNSYESGISIVRSADGATTWLNVRGGATNFNNKNNAGNAGLPYRWYQNGTERLKIESSGAVTFNTAFTFPTADGSAGQVLQTNGSGTVTWATVSGGGGVSGSGTDHYIPRWNGTTALQDSSVIALDSGSVGIGTATPTGRLTIKSSGNSSYALEVQSSLDADKIFGVYQDGDGDGALYLFNKDTTTTVGLSSVGNSWLTGGNFGIGTNSPSADLHIGAAFSDASNDLSSPALAIKQTGLGVEQGIYLERGGERKGYYIGMAGLDGLAFQRNFAGTKSVVMTLDRTGNVGIGTDSTAYRLEVKGSVTGDWLSRIYNTATTSNPSGLLVRIDDADSTGMILGVNNNGTYHMVVKGDGNVGIGTNAPAAKLEVQGLEVKIGAASPTSAAHYLRLKYDNSEGIIDSNRGKLKLQSNEDIVYTLDNFGINVASPGYKLDVEESSGNEIARFQGANSGSITFRNAASNVFRIYAGGSDSLGFAAGNSFNADHLTINASGTITFNNAFTFPTSDGSAGQVLQTNGSGTVTWATVSGGGGVSGSGTDNYIPRWNGTTGLQNSSIYADDNGKVAIGTATPDANHNLTIVNTTNYGIRFTGTNATIQSNANLINVAANNIYLRPATGYEVVVDSGKGLSVVNTTSDAAGIFESRENGGVAVVKLRAKDLSAPSSALPADQGAALQFQGWDGSSFETMATIFAATEGTAANGDIPSSLRFMTTPDGAAAATEKMRIKADGNVGIGTNAPDTKLHIEGVTKTSATVESTDNHAELIIKSENNTYSPYLVFKDAGADRYFIQANPSDSLLFRPQGTGTVSNWVVFSNNGSVGIGTDAPDGKLHVTNTTYIDVATNTGTASALIWRRLDKTIVGRIVADTTNLKTQIWDNNSAVVTIGSDQVGIGTDAPTRLLTLENNTGTVVNQSQLRINNAGAGDSYIYMYAGADWSFGIDNSDADKFKFNISNDVSDGTEVLTLQRDGSVGIGTNAPASLLHVGGAAASPHAAADDFVIAPAATDVGMTIRCNSNSGTGSIFFADTAGNAQGTVRYNHNTDYMSFSSSGDYFFDISNGCVGIGTATPTVPLHVYTNSASGQEIMLENDGAGEVGLILRTDRGSDGNLLGWLGFDGNDDGGTNTRYATIESYIVDNTNGTEDGAIRFSVMAGGNDRESMTISARSGVSDIGFVGIGSNAPTFPLQVYGANQTNGSAKRIVAFFDTTSAAAGTGAGIALGGYTNGTSGGINDFGVIQGIKENGTAGNYASALTFHTRANGANTVERMRLSSDGKLLINATSPTLNTGSTLYVNGNAYASEFELPSGGKLDWANGDATIEEGLTSNYSLSLRNYDGSSAMVTTMFLKSGGNVGIGTVAPAAHLHIEKSMGATTVLTQVAANSTVGYEIKKTGSTTQHWKIVDGQTANGYLEIYDATDSATRMAFNTAGNVGIGTVNAPHLLTIKGDDKYFAAYASDGSIAAQLGSDSSGDGNFVLYDHSGGTKVKLYAESGGANYINNGGNLGIGTNNPSAAYGPVLHIRGTNPVLRLDGTGANSWAWITMNTATASEGRAMGLGADGSFRVTANSASMDANIQLHITQAGAVTFNSAFTFPNADGSAGQVLQTNGSGTVTWSTVSGGGGVSGSGTDHYIPRWNGTTALQDSSIIALDNGYVGIGTATPGARLDVNGTVYFRSTSVKGVISCPSSDIFDIANASGGSSNPITFSTQGSERVRIDHTGNVGIGTNLPSHRLQVLGATTGGWNGLNLNVVISSSNTYSNGHAGGIAFGGAYNSSETQTVLAGVWASRPNAGNGQYAGMVHIGGREHGTSNIAQVLTVTHANVGIGTNAPLDKLDVYGTGAIFRNLSDDADSVQIVRGTNHTASPDAKFYIYDNSSADWAAKINLDGASYGLDITGGVNYFLLCRDASGNRMFEVHNTSVVVNDGSTDMDFRVEGNGDDYLLFTDGGNDRVAISTNTPAAKLHVEGDFKVGASNNGNWMGYKDVAMNGSSYTTALTINLANHTACHVKLFLSGDWSGHSAVAFVGEYFIQNSADGYQEPGQIISEFDNTNTDLIMSKIVDPSSDTFTIQLKLSTTANGSFTGKLSYHIMGMATAVS